MTRRHAFSLASLIVFGAAACGGAKAAATAAIAAADQAVAALPPEAAKVAPDLLKPITDAVAQAREQLATADYSAAMASVKGVGDMAKALTDSIGPRVTAFKATLDTLGVAMPRNLAAMKTKLDQIAKSKTLPRGLDAQQLQEAKDALAEATTGWSDVQKAAESGDLANAMGEAMRLKARVSRSLSALGLAADEKAWSNVTLPPR